jgi:hypothetical protein
MLETRARPQRPWVSKDCRYTESHHDIGHSKMVHGFKAIQKLLILAKVWDALSIIEASQ